MILNAPWIPSRAYLETLPFGQLSALYHGPTTIPTNESGVADLGNGGKESSEAGIYAAAKELGIYTRVPDHKYSDVNAAQIVQRILENREILGDDWATINTVS